MMKPQAGGMLAKQLFVVFTGTDRQRTRLELQMNTEIRSRSNKEVCLLRVRWPTTAAKAGVATAVIIRADSEEATKIAEADPMHSSGARKFNIRHG